MTKLTPILVLASLLTFGRGVLASTEIWDANGGNWGNAANWSNNVPGSGDTAAFDNTGSGETNTLDADYNVTRIIYNPDLTNDPHYNGDVSNSYASVIHTTDLNGNTLTISGYLDAGITDDANTILPGDWSQTMVTFSGGTLRPSNIRMAYMINGDRTYYGTEQWSYDWSCTSVVTVSGTFDCSSLSDVSLGRSDVAYRKWTRSRNATLDLTGAIVVTGGISNKFQAGSLSIGRGPSCIGHLLLPDSVTNVVVTGNMVLGNLGVWTNYGYGYTCVATTGDFAPPSNITFQVGAPGSPADLMVGYNTGYRYDHSVQANFILSGGEFVPYLADLNIGYNTANAANSQTHGTLDLSTTPVADNTLAVTNLRIADGEHTVGILKLTDTTGVTNLTVTGDFTVGVRGGIGNIGALSGSDYILPGGINVKLGVDAANRGLLWIGHRPVGELKGWANEGKLITSGGTFEAYLTEMRVGVNEYTLNTRATEIASGLLDLRDSTLTGAGLNVSGGSVAIGVASNPLVNWTTIRQSGAVYVPPGNAIAGTLTVGSPTNTGMAGLLVMSGTVFVVENSLTVGQTGVISNRVDGGSTGVDLRSSDPGDFVMETNARMHIIFQRDPGAQTMNYWGLRMAGDNTALFNTYTNDNRITYDISGLPARKQNLFGVYYDSGYTHLGFKQIAGTVFLVK